MADNIAHANMLFSASDNTLCWRVFGHVRLLFFTDTVTQLTDIFTGYLTQVGSFLTWLLLCLNWVILW